MFIALVVAMDLVFCIRKVKKSSYNTKMLNILWEDSLRGLTMELIRSWRGGFFYLAEIKI